MEIKAILQKPYSENERMDFIVEYNHNQGYVIEETETETQALGYTEEELAHQELERNAMLNLTAADVERGIYKAKGMDFDDVIALVESYNEAAPLDAEGNPAGVDIKALKIELKANNFYYGNSYVQQIGAILGFTDEQMLEFFKTGDYTKLM